MKMINYNVLHGFNNDSLLENRFVDWAKRQGADIFSFQELNGFTEERLAALAKRYGHAYVAINTDVTHPIGLTSRFPITNVQRETVKMWHSYLYGNINGLHVFVTHLSPFEVKLRRQDVDLLLTKAKQLPAGEGVIIAGDFNAVAAKDSAHYGKDLLTAMRRSEGRREPKSGLPIVKGKTIYRNNLDNGKMDYTVTNKMIVAGFNDAFYLTNRTFKNSVPTKGHATKNSKIRRIDFVWVNNALAKQVKAVDIVQDEETHTLSDHYPVIMTLGTVPRN
ncbi:endonuclease/exonuclease/phosphatase family protein [Flavisolibacter sp. BT320]|nr:endonuclease/exonuclease/phosphatase family protein [Flavisolibacter longurius]